MVDCRFLAHLPGGKWEKRKTYMASPKQEMGDKNIIFLKNHFCCECSTLSVNQICKQIIFPGIQNQVMVLDLLRSSQPSIKAETANSCKTG